MNEPLDLAGTRLANALRLFDEFVAQHVKRADAATLRGLEKRFAERLLIQPSYWSQIKARSRQIGERLARQFERSFGKPSGWLDQPAGAAPTTSGAAMGASAAGAGHVQDDGPGNVPGYVPGNGQGTDTSAMPQGADERFIVGLVLTYYRRHPQQARQRLLHWLGEALSPAEMGEEAAAPAASARDPAASRGVGAGSKAPPPLADDTAWSQARQHVTPLRAAPKRKR